MCTTQFSHNIQGELPRMCLHNILCVVRQDLNLSIRPSCTGKSALNSRQPPTYLDSQPPDFEHSKKLKIPRGNEKEGLQYVLPPARVVGAEQMGSAEEGMKQFDQISYALAQNPVKSAVPKRGRSKCGRTPKSAKERKRKSARERAQRSAKGRKTKKRKRKRALPRKNCKQLSLKQPGLGTLN